MITTVIARTAVIGAVVAGGLAFQSGAMAAPTAGGADQSGGQSLVVRISVTTTPSTTTPGRTDYGITRVVGVLKPGLSPADVRPDSSTSGCEQDGSYSVQLCGTVNYAAYQGSGGYRYASMSSVVNQAIRDDGQARLTNLAFDIGATGPCGQGCSGQPQHDYAGNITSPASGSSHSQSVPWSGQYQRVSQSPADLMGLRQDLSWARGTGSYNLTNAVNVPPA